VFRMKLLGSEVVEVDSGSMTLKDACNEALRYWVAAARHTHYIIGSVVGPHPYPLMVRDFQSVIGKEAKEQILAQEGRLPDYLVACVGGGSNSMGLFYPFLGQKVAMVGVEAAGLGVAILGSAYMMLIVLVLSLPIGVAASIYLEEFAPTNRLTDLIEVNISNLAAVPSIVFGILGLAIFINYAGLPQSAPVVGGLVLTLMTLPTIIIATRASLKAVPPSIREAALGVGASKMQTVFHHVLPLAMPGILTGTIIGLAQALGETAPLLLIGMVAFVREYPSAPPEGFFEPASALPVQVYNWTQRGDPAFIERASGAIIVLLIFLLAMNLIAIILRRRFERRW